MAAREALFDNAKEALKTAIETAATTLPEDIERALRAALAVEEDKTARKQIETMLENARVASERRVPLCQDTGLVHFTLKVGVRFPLIAKLRELVEAAVREATAEVPLRPNAVDPFTGVNSGDNTGELVPVTDTHVVKGGSLEATVVLRGGGSDNWTALHMLPPSSSMEDVKKVVVSHVVKAGGAPCPPLVVGVGIGGTPELAVKLSKVASARPILKTHVRPAASLLEHELLRLVNETGIGPMGLGGKTTALAVNVEYAYRHTASLPVAISLQCWAVRRATVIVKPDGEFEVVGTG
jgi:fumarate hydratase subunit alpha